jgi:hypothetical protein
MHRDAMPIGEGLAGLGRVEVVVGQRAPGVDDALEPGVGVDVIAVLAPPYMFYRESLMRYTGRCEKDFNV